MFTAVMSTPCEPIVNDHTPVHINLDIQGKVELVLLVRNHLCLSQHVPASSEDEEISFAHVKETAMLVVSLRDKDMVNFSLNLGVMNEKLIFFPIKISIVSIKCL